MEAVWGELERCQDSTLLRETLGQGMMQQHRMNPGKFRSNSGENVFNMRTSRALEQVAHSDCEISILGCEIFIFGVFQSMAWRWCEAVGVSGHPLLRAGDAFRVAFALATQLPQTHFLPAVPSLCCCRAHPVPPMGLCILPVLDLRRSPAAPSSSWLQSLLILSSPQSGISAGKGSVQTAWVFTLTKGEWAVLSPPAPFAAQPLYTPALQTCSEI